VLCQFNADSLQFTPDERSRLREVCRRAARCVFVSRHNLELARVQLALPLTDAVVVPNPIRVRLDQPLALTGRSEVVRFANVARFHNVWKGQQNLLSLLAKPPWRDRPWELSFYGEGPDQDQLQQFASVLDLENRVFFRGYVREVEQIWRTNDVLLLPSVGEGMSLAMIEAMMCGRPVVANSVGGVSECLVDGKSGYVSSGTSKQDFALALERAWNSRDNWEAVGWEAHRRARELAAFEPGRGLLGTLRDCAEGKRTADQRNPLGNSDKI
jgi:glycosyltransferase involved in cell wall biosynthesis